MSIKFSKLPPNKMRNLWLLGLAVAMFVGAALQVWFNKGNLYLEVDAVILLLNIAIGAFAGIGCYIAISAFTIAGALMRNALSSKVYKPEFKFAGILIAGLSTPSYWMVSSLFEDASKHAQGGTVRYLESVSASLNALPLSIAFLVCFAIALQLAINIFWNLKLKRS